jgi:queuosine precursor transporter
MKNYFRHVNFLDIFTITFIVSLLAANIVGVKLIQVGAFVIPAGTIIFPISYVVNDVLTEVYGFKAARRVIWLGFFSNLFLVLVIYIAQILPSAPFWDGQQAYERILGFAPRILLASFLAYLAGSFANAWVMARMKTLTKERWLWSRTIGSTVLGEGIDSFIFMLVAFSGTVPTQGWVNSAITIWFLKTLYETLATPLTYYIINGVKRREALQPEPAMSLLK